MAYTTSVDFGLVWADQNSQARTGKAPQDLPRREKRREVTAPVAAQADGASPRARPKHRRGEVTFVSFKDYSAPCAQPGDENKPPTVPDAEPIE
jgi:hypothetical protein